MTGRATLVLLVATAAGQAQTIEDFLNPNVLQEVRITINPKDWTTLQEKYLTNDYYPCNVQWRNLSVENVAVRVKGKTTRRSSKPGLRVDINRYEDQKFLGEDVFLLDNNILDFSGLKEPLTMKLFTMMGLPAPRETHARLYVNGQYMGLYALVEGTDKVFLKRWYNEDNGQLYEYQFVEGYRLEYKGDNASLYAPVPFEPKTHENDPQNGPLVAMIRTINQVSDADFVRAASEYLDLKKFLTHMAVESYMAEWDGIISDYGMNNFYFYRFAGKNLGQFIPKDKDNTFRSIDYPMFKNNSVYVLMRRTLAVPELRDFYYSEIVRAMTLAGGAGGWLEQEIDREYQLIRDAMRTDSLKECPEGPCSLDQSNQIFEINVDFLKRFARERPAEVVRQLAAAGYTVSTSPPRLVQGGAVNAATNQLGPVAPGSLVALYGQNLANSTLAANVPWPTSMGGGQVEVNGQAAPLYYVSPGQVNFQLPWETSLGTAQLQAVSAGLRSEIITIEVGPVSPGVFAIVNNADGSVPNASRPATAGDYLIIYANGLGAVSNRPPTGSGAPTSPLAQTLETPVVTIGGVTATVAFSGLTPSYVGLYQLNVQVPGGVTPGSSVPVLIRVGGLESVPALVAIR